MGLRFNSNIDAMNAHRHLATTSSALSRSMQRLASGLRINSAADDPAGLAISEKMRGQISGLAQAQRNAQDGISLAQIADGSLQSIVGILQRVRELATQFNSGTYDASASAAITQEVAQLEDEINSIISGTMFGSTALLSGGGVLLTLQIGTGNSDYTTISSTSTSTAVGTIVSTFVGTAYGTTVDLDAIDDSISNVINIASSFGAVQNRLEMTIDSLSSRQSVLSEAESNIRDVDFAEEMMNFTRLQIMQEAGLAMMAQANQQQRSVLTLLTG